MKGALSAIGSRTINRLRSKPLLNIFAHNALEFVGYARAAQGHRLLAVDEDGRGWGFAGAGQGYADVRVLAFAGAVHSGSAPTMNDLLSGYVQAMLGDLQNVAEHVRAGKLVALAVANEKRIASLPETPTLIESGLAGFTSKSWFGMVARAGTPADVVQKWNGAIRAALKSEAVRKKLEPLGVELADISVEDFAAFLKAEGEQARYAVEVSGAKGP